MTAVIALRGLRRAFRTAQGPRVVLDQLELTVAPRELIAIVGASGSGKSTLLNILGALDSGFEGEATLFGASLRGLDDDARTLLRSRSIGFVFQSFHLLEHLSVGENVKLPLWLSPARDEVLAGRSEDACVLSALETVGLASRVQESIGPLSGGERQRVAIARALVHAPQLILADEPTGNLDVETAKPVLEVLDGARRAGDRAVVIVTHDPRVAERADRVYRLAGGKLTEEPRS